MRGTFFHAGNEILIETTGESWHQGEEIHGHVSSVGSEGSYIILALIDIKKFNAKKSDGKHNTNNTNFTSSDLILTITKNNISNSNQKNKTDADKIKKSKKVKSLLDKYDY